MTERQIEVAKKRLPNYFKDMTPAQRREYEELYCRGYLVVCNYGEAATLTAEITDIGAFTAIDGNTNKPVNVSGNKVTFKLGKYGYIFLKGKVTK